MKKKLVTGLCYFLVVLILNGSLDVEIFHPHGSVPLSQPINNIESLVELGLEWAVDIEDAIPEEGADDEIPTTLKKTLVFLFNPRPGLPRTTSFFEYLAEMKNPEESSGFVSPPFSPPKA